jgi:RNA polymerase sigma factor (sigma-70 family)
MLTIKRRGGTAAKIRARGDANDGESSQPSVVADLNEMGDLMRGCLKGLDDKQRDAIELAFLGGHTQEEIATKLEEPLGTIKARIRRGLMKLRDCLEKKV